MLAVTRAGSSSSTSNLLSVTYYDTVTGNEVCQRQLPVSAKTEFAFHYSNRFLVHQDCTLNPIVALHEANFTKRPAQLVETNFVQATCKGYVL